jgi:hypothetical protein
MTLPRTVADILADHVAFEGRDPAPTLQLPGDGLHPKRPPREACLADRTTRSTCRVLAQKG